MRNSYKLLLFLLIMGYNDQLVAEQVDNRNVIDSSINPADRLYDAIMGAEHREGFFKSLLQPNYDPWIRTKAKGTGSSAYGPLQINKAMLSGIGYGDVGFDEAEDKWIQEKYLPQM